MLNTVVDESGMGTTHDYPIVNFAVVLYER